MIYPIATQHVLYFQLYGLLVCTITLIVSSVAAVAATKKNTKTKHAIKKAKELKHYSANPNYFFESDINYLTFTVEGEPVSLKRVASGKWGRYDSQKWVKQSFNNAFEELQVIHNEPLWQFGRDEVKVDLTFTFTKSVVRNDIDNLVKFILDCLETADVFDNDVQVMDLRVRKRKGNRDTTLIKVTRKAAMDDDDEVIVID